MKLKYLHTMVRVSDLDASLDFYCGKLGLQEVRRFEAVTNEKVSFEELGGARNFGHLAYSVENIYALCEKLMAEGITINRPPRDGRMAFIRSPDDISIELLQAGEALPIQEPWASMENVGEW